ncbi:hypothetical protein GCM10011490_07430 [Pseudoclavibacter endophyticus]|uniref:Endonuclease/exonuclease/phosphatase family protein n=1 Tax=Pseudoclavibacter endophyticus TaxID=1778590 RepID=A0A6H9WLS0_9MICO|nr:endonuclease/exonuclease/phosphatase family protein [Pseudoclavibacter endophyticus]KAB1649776.1 endonuclease/exonuclease/phosphatase family protein [Pseudoclavibacter endophyticus]GGA59826.1 hypothetical protein GCM10011490_07430 [Pseudoclavibacter endophyticus]
MPKSVRRTSPGTAIAAIVLALITLAAATVLFAPHLLGLQRTIFVAQAIPFRVPIVIGATVLLFGLLIAIASSRGARRLLGGVAIVLTVFVVASVGLVASRGIGDPNVPAEYSAEDIRVLSWNTRGDEPGSPAIATLAIDYGADVVVLPETTEEMGVEIANLMAEAGSPMWVHTRTFDEEYRATSTTLLIAPDLGDYVVVTDEGDTGTLPTVIARPLGTGPTIVAAHPVAPTPLNMDQWETDLEWLAGLCAGNVIMAGDFNATIDHLVGLGATDSNGGSNWVTLGEPAETAYDFGECVDGARATGNGALGTWTTGLPPLLGAQIDHVMATSQWRFTGFEVVTSVDRAGSDHRPVFAQLSPAYA